MLGPGSSRTGKIAAIAEKTGRFYGTTGIGANGMLYLSLGLVLRRRGSSGRYGESEAGRES